MPDVDEYGIPIKKKKTTQQEVDEFGIPIKKKPSGVSVTEGGGLASASGEGWGSDITQPKNVHVIQNPYTSAGRKAISKWDKSLSHEENLKLFSQRLQADTYKEGDVFVQPVTKKEPSVYEKTRQAIKEKNGKFALALHDIATVGEEMQKSAAKRAITITADIADWIGATAKKVDDAINTSPFFGGMANPLFGKADTKEQKDYSMTKNAAQIRKFANDLIPLNPELQDKFMVQLATGGVDLAAAIITRSPVGAAEYGAMVQGGSEFRNAYDKYTDFQTLTEDEAVQKYAADENEAQILREHIREFKKSGQTPEDASFTTLAMNSLIGTSDALPILKYFRKLDKYTGGTVSNILKKTENSAFQQLLNTPASKITIQAIQEGSQEVIQEYLSNVTAKETYDRTRNVLQGLEEAGTVGGVLGAITEAMLGIHTKNRQNITDPKEMAIHDATAKYLNEKKSQYDSNPEAFKTESKEKEQLYESLEKDISPESRKAVAQKIEEAETIKPDNKTLAIEVDKQYQNKISVLEKDLSSVPDEAKPAIEQKLNEIKAERDEVINGIEPGFKSPKPTAAEKIVSEETIPGTYAIGAKENPELFLKEIANQAHGIDYDGNPLPYGSAEKALIEQGFQKTLIDKAKKLFPAPPNKEIIPPYTGLSMGDVDIKKPFESVDEAEAELKRLFEEDILNREGKGGKGVPVEDAYKNTVSALDKIAEAGKGNPVTQRVVDFLKPILQKNPNIQIDTEYDFKDDPALGKSFKDGRIAINFKRISNPEMLHNVVLHEMVHAATRFEIANNPALRTELMDILGILRDDLGIESIAKMIPELVRRGVVSEDIYGFTNEHEMIAELFSNTNFHAMLKKVKYKGDNLLKRFFLAIAKYFSQSYKQLTQAKKEISADNIADYLMDLTEKTISGKQGTDAAGELSSLKNKPQAEQEKAIKEFIERSKNLDRNEIRALIKKYTNLPESKIRELSRDEKEFEKFKKLMIEGLESNLDAAFDYKIYTGQKPKIARQALQNIKDGKDTLAAREMIESIGEMFDEGMVFLQRGVGGQTEVIEMSIEDYKKGVQNVDYTNELGKLEKWVANEDMVLSLEDAEVVSDILNDTIKYHEPETNEGEGEQPSKTTEKSSSKGLGESISDKQIEAELKEATKPELTKVDFLTEDDFEKLESGNIVSFAKKHAKIENEYKTLMDIFDCLWGKK